jgi:hypothetical protein
MFNGLVLGIKLFVLLSALSAQEMAHLSVNRIAGSAVKFSTNIKMRGEKARIDFDLRPSAAKKTRNYVWVPGRSGSNGDWVEVGDTGSVKKAKAGQFQREQLQSGDVRSVPSGR